MGGVNGAMMPNQNMSQANMHPNVIKVVFMEFDRILLRLIGDELCAVRDVVDFADFIFG